MRTLLFILFLAAFGHGTAQSIIGINFSYLYDDDPDVTFRAKVVRHGRQAVILYRIESNRKDIKIGDYTVSWEQRASVNTRSGPPIESMATDLYSDDRSRTSRLEVAVGEKSWYALARVVHVQTKAEFFYHVPVEANWPVVFHLEHQNDGIPVLEEYVSSRSEYRIQGLDEKRKAYGFYYRQPFAAALPPFAGNTPAERFLRADSTFVVDDSRFRPSGPGLYLIQQDTGSAEGLSVWVGDSPFPRYNKIPSLVGPLLYVTTGEEQQVLKSVGQDKTKFDKVILGITRDKERAKGFMRSYFKRVEESNRMFTGYKEGWMTDRGMIRLIFGPPSEVSKTSTNEIWFYKDTRQKFVFYRNGSVYEPIGYFLQRSESYTQNWYSTIDLWRKGRF